jgi:hypothetical protein
MQPAFLYLVPLLMLQFPVLASAKILITAAEVSFPDDPFVERGPFPGPRLVVELPPPSIAAIRSPLRLKVRFQPRGAKIDISSLVISYKKSPPVDLTDRVKDFATVSGIDMRDAEVPPGIHKIRIDVKDTDGLPGRVEFTLNVQK